MWYVVCGQAVARNPLYFNLLSTFPECFIDQNKFYMKFHTPYQSILACDLIAVGQQVDNLESSVVVHELVFAIYLASYGLL